MTDPIVSGQQRMLDPVQAEESEVQQSRWSGRLVIFLRVMAAGAMLKGLYHWSIVLGIGTPPDVTFESYPLPFQVATAFFAVIDLVAAVGLWLAAPWGAVVWLTSVISMAAVEALFPQVYGGRTWVIAVELALLAFYLLFALMAAREQPA